MKETKGFDEIEEHNRKVDEEMWELGDADVYPEEDKEPAVVTPNKLSEPEDKHKWEEPAVNLYAIYESEEKEEGNIEPAVHTSERRVQLMKQEQEKEQEQEEARRELLLKGEQLDERGE